MVLGVPGHAVPHRSHACRPRGEIIDDLVGSGDVPVEQDINSSAGWDVVQLLSQSFRELILINITEVSVRPTGALRSWL